ncbi:hypothetical protein ACGFYF_41020 [Streptomyces lavendulae]|uniref:hypothetical protein n=1 Tax=Streptomyces lavendulae TaxID=1914 RepID=UPI003718B613
MTALDDDAETGPLFEVPSISTFGAVYRMSIQTDARGAVLVAYTRDSETGRVTRSSLRFDQAGVAYVRRRLSGQ